MDPLNACKSIDQDGSHDVVNRLRARAQRHHRSLQGELMVILEEAVRQPALLPPEGVLEEIRRLGLATDGDSAGIVRQARDGR